MVRKKAKIPWAVDYWAVVEEKPSDKPDWPHHRMIDISYFETKELAKSFYDAMKQSEPEKIKDSRFEIVKLKGSTRMLS